ncbi:hypothetical protein ACWC2K_33720 [Streptomyces chattanoogensis]|uniref:hypothetical protein n=1 Tax=Streptomyces chattanoogensis TaxID=66876 RepID=UPI0036902818
MGALLLAGRACWALRRLTSCCRVAERFGDEWDAYATRTPAFWPTFHHGAPATRLPSAPRHAAPPPPSARR